MERTCSHRDFSWSFFISADSHEYKGGRALHCTHLHKRAVRASSVVRRRSRLVVWQRKHPYTHAHTWSHLPHSADNLIMRLFFLILLHVAMLRVLFCPLQGGEVVGLLQSASLCTGAFRLGKLGGGGGGGAKLVGGPNFGGQKRKSKKKF